MAQQTINIGTNANDGTGDPLRTAFDKINDNFTELYGTTAEANDLKEDTTPQLGGDLDVNGQKIVSARSNEQIILDPNGTGTVELNANTNVTGNLTATGDITATGNIFANGNINLGNGAGDQTKVVGVFEADQLQIDGTTLTSTVTNGAVTIQGNGTGGVNVADVTINDNQISASNSNSNLIITGSGTGAVKVDAIKISGTTISSDDSTKVTVAEALDVTGALKTDTSLALATGATVTGILDEDNMATNSATQLATQQSIKAYADTKSVLTGSTNNTITTVTGANALQGEANLTFNGSTLAVTGGGTFSAGLSVTGVTTVNGQLDAEGITIKDNKIATNASNSSLEVGAAGTGTVNVSSPMTTLGQTATGLVTIDGELNVDNIGINGNGIAAINSNGGININPNGTGGVTIGGIVANVANFLQVGKELFVNEKIELGPQSHIQKLSTNSDLRIETVGTGLVTCNAVGFTGNKVTSVNTNDNLKLDANGTGVVELMTNTLARTGDLIVDVSGSIILDADSGTVFVRDGAAGNYGQFIRNGSNDLTIASGATQAVIFTGSKAAFQGNLSVTGAQVDFTNLPTSDPGVAGRLWRDGTTVKISV
tara:strand:- start:696 stop:2495 length:1800 start_codon:yes stop_codon:yes gene_type:complete